MHATFLREGKKSLGRQDSDVKTEHWGAENIQNKCVSDLSPILVSFEYVNGPSY